MPVCSVQTAKAQMGTDCQVWFNGSSERQDRMRERCATSRSAEVRWRGGERIDYQYSKRTNEVKGSIET